MSGNVIYRRIEITNKRISRLKYVLLLLLIALIGTGAYFLAQHALQQALHNVTLSSYVSILVGAVVTGTGLVILNRYLINHGIMIPTLRRRILEQGIFIVPGSGRPIDEELIRRHEDALNFADSNSEGYVAGLVVLGFMYLQNAVTYGNRDLYLKAGDYLDKAMNTMGTVHISDEVKMLIERLGREIERNKARFEGS